MRKLMVDVLTGGAFLMFLLLIGVAGGAVASIMPQFDGKPTQAELRRRAARARAVSHVRDLVARPTCAVCGIPVQRITEEEGPWGELVFTVWCHGDRERAVIESCDVKSISFGQAFAGSPRRLEGK